MSAIIWIDRQDFCRPSNQIKLEYAIDEISAAHPDFFMVDNGVPIRIKLRVSTIYPGNLCKATPWIKDKDPIRIIRKGTTPIVEHN